MPCNHALTSMAISSPYAVRTRQYAPPLSTLPTTLYYNTVQPTSHINITHQHHTSIPPTQCLHNHQPPHTHHSSHPSATPATPAPQPPSSPPPPTHPTPAPTPKKRTTKPPTNSFSTKWPSTPRTTPAPSSAKASTCGAAAMEGETRCM